MRFSLGVIVAALTGAAMVAAAPTANGGEIAKRECNWEEFEKCKEACCISPPGPDGGIACGICIITCSEQSGGC